MVNNKNRKMSQRIYLLLLTVLIAVKCYGQDTTYQPPQVGIAIVTADSIITMKVWGHHKMGQTGKEDTATLQDYWHLGSNTKAVTGVIAAKLVEQGKIKWTTPFFELFPTWKKDALPAYHNITLEQLLSHRAGIRAYTSGVEMLTVPKKEGTVADKRKAFSQYVLTQEPVNTENKFTYSNAGYSLAAAMLEKASDKTWEELVEDIINKQLKLHAGFGWPNLKDEHQPWGHWANMGKIMPVAGNIEYNLAMSEPAGDLKMTLPDYVRFIQLNLKGLKGDATYLKPATWQYLHSGVEGYAIGWSHVDQNGKQYSEHMGSAGTYLCYTLINVTSGKAIIIVTNEGTQKAQKYLMDTRNKIMAGTLR